MTIEISDTEYEAALARGRARLSRPHATGARYDAESRLLTVSFSTGSSFSFDPAQADLLERLPDEALSEAYLTPSGGGLIFGDALAVSLPGLLKTVMPPQDWEATFDNPYCDIEVRDANS